MSFILQLSDNKDCGHLLAPYNLFDYIILRIKLYSEKNWFELIVHIKIFKKSVKSIPGQEGQLL